MHHKEAITEPYRCHGGFIFVSYVRRMSAIKTRWRGWYGNNKMV